MKYLFTVIIIFLLPLSVYGVEWTVEYEMIHPDGKVKFVTVSVPTILKDRYWKLPYLAGRWECSISKSKSVLDKSTNKYFYSNLIMMCFIKEKRDVSVLTEIGCDNGYIRNTKENRLQVGLKGAKVSDLWVITVECKL